MLVRRLNREGLDRFSSFLDSVAGDSPLAYPEDLLVDPGATLAVVPSVKVDRRGFRNRFELASYLSDRIGAADIRDLESDVGLWSWLALFYFEELCPRVRNGRRKPGERARWILNTSYRSHYRHLLAGPYRTYRAHLDDPGRVMPLLAGPPSEMSGLYREIAARQELLTNKAVLDVVRRLYLKPRGRRLKTGASAPDTPGGIRRFVEVLNQFDVTWDLYSIDADTLYWILPEEFDRFRQ
jgi:hypothetical protein